MLHVSLVIVEVVRLLHSELLIEALLKNLHELLGQQRLVARESRCLLSQVHHDVI